MSQVILIKGTNEAFNNVDRIAAAIASNCISRFNKRTLILQTNASHPVEDVMLGYRLHTEKLTGEFAMNDEGIDALLRRAEMGTLTREQFSDCCVSIVKQMNNFDIASPPTDKDFSRHLCENDILFKQLLKSAINIYEFIIIIADANDKPLISKLEANEDITKIVICVSQGEAEKYDKNPVKQTVFVVDEFDPNSVFNMKVLNKVYGTKAIFPILYNTAFRDACIKNQAVRFLFTDYKPETEDANYEFVERITNLVSFLIGMDEPVIKERYFVYRKRPKTVKISLEEKREMTLKQPEKLPANNSPVDTQEEICDDFDSEPTGEGTNYDF